ncbi:hypothetical protein COV05_00855 [Candidatus Uhrbacteria bacterium CG10_big_fil_rev_8_21_14_0_10_48_16]|uniref:Lipoprotein n=1 Tax=Candidatus Uhrbacteria bacterium CG10_big_fil_rev_8_21_14_0_10_48_16 TaxID=1975038 RepID=A0A2M8LI75_9BACT|nr:MAG: hypothetical protein COV05_00855 [Candidatus Uhrbacteria bacterium CG10_big_fil_rev_8_21_14_0_10_48_16]
MVISGLLVLLIGGFFAVRIALESGSVMAGDSSENMQETQAEEVVETIDVEEYLQRMRALAHVSEEESLEEHSVVENPPALLWPVTDAPVPNPGALLPFHRIVAYYGNFYSTRMGILGEYSRDEVLRRLSEAVLDWEEADPSTPVMPAIDYIAVTAQASPGSDGLYRFRMPEEHIERAIAMADEIDGIVILEVQAGLANLMDEVEHLEPYLTLPQVHLAIDPEFAMKYRQPPGTAVGTVDASELNTIAEYLAELVQTHDLPPKILVVHRYTQAMVTNSDQITPLTDVQVVMDMDGWGTPGQKVATYEAYIKNEPVQFTGFKVFYKNDVRYAGSYLMSPEQILQLLPQPIFVQYQ